MALNIMIEWYYSLLCKGNPRLCRFSWGIGNGIYFTQNAREHTLSYSNEAIWKMEESNWRIYTRDHWFSSHTVDADQFYNHCYWFNYKGNRR